LLVGNILAGKYFHDPQVFCAHYCVKRNKVFEMKRFSDLKATSMEPSSPSFESFFIGLSRRFSALSCCALFVTESFVS
jgi:hypothetical protein